MQGFWFDGNNIIAKVADGQDIVTGYKVSYQDLGYANFWGVEWPAMYKLYIELVQSGKISPAKEEIIGRCLREYTCKELGIKWKVDSGD